MLLKLLSTTIAVVNLPKLKKKRKIISCMRKKPKPIDKNTGKIQSVDVMTFIKRHATTTRVREIGIGIN